MSLVKSKQRVANHGEVFTPSWMVEAMLDLVKDETLRIDSRFLEPACGSGNFMVATALPHRAYGGRCLQRPPALAARSSSGASDCRHACKLSSAASGSVRQPTATHCSMPSTM